MPQPLSHTHAGDALGGWTSKPPTSYHTHHSHCMSSGQDLQAQSWHPQLHVLLKPPSGPILPQAVWSGGGSAIPLGGDPHCRHLAPPVSPAVHTVTANSFAELAVKSYNIRGVPTAVWLSIPWKDLSSNYFTAMLHRGLESPWSSACSKRNDPGSKLPSNLLPNLISKVFLAMYEDCRLRNLNLLPQISPWDASTIPATELSSW